jgi:TPR repeat protein
VKPKVAETDKTAPNRVPPLRLALLFIIAFCCFTLLPRVRNNPRMEWAFIGAAAFLIIFYTVVRIRVGSSGRVLHYDFVPQKAHWVQMIMQGMIYLYWGLYWDHVFPFLPFIAAQILFVYTLDMLITYSRRDNWVLGFGPMPIILSTNLFIWFRDDWFAFQFVLISIGVLGKQFLRWHREGKFVHIFNPSAFSAFVISVCLLATHTSRLTWGEDIATTVSRPPYIYLEIFLLGLVVQSLFSVTLVTLSAAVAMLVLNLGYTHTTGVYHYIDSSIPVSVFLGLHLLITDPATSPRKTIGKILFGLMYGSAIFGLYSALRWYGQPDFYDKLLCVPLLNLMVPGLDRLSNSLATSRLAEKFRLLKSEWALNPARYNFAHMALWVTLFAGMISTGFLAKGSAHPGGSLNFWAQACQDGKWNGCKTYVQALTVTCQFNRGQACVTGGEILSQADLVPRDPALASDLYSRACSLGVPEGCDYLRMLVRRGGAAALEKACDHYGADYTGESCYTLGQLLSDGTMGVELNPEHAFKAFTQSCDNDFAHGCYRQAQSYMDGLGTTADPAMAVKTFEKGCRDRDASSCADLGDIYRRGVAGRKDQALATKRLQQACDLGMTSACQTSDADATDTH